MHFTEVKKQEIKKFYRRTKILSLIDEFKESGMECARLEDWEYSSAKIGANTINLSIKHFKIQGVHAHTRKGEIYLVRTDV